MFKGFKIRLLPTKEQEQKFRQSAGVARWCYNYYLGRNKEVYQTYLDNGKTGEKRLSCGDIKKEITQLKKQNEFKWLKDVSSQMIAMAVSDADKAFQDFLSGKHGRPHFKSKRKSKISFYVRYDRLYRRQNGFQGEKLGTIRTAQSLPKLAKNKHYSNPRISYDGINWYLSLGIDVKDIEKPELTDDVIGVDLGIKSLAVTFSKYAKEQNFIKNINKSRRVIKLEKKLKRAQRRLNRKLDANTESYTEIKRTEKQSSGRKPNYRKPLHECLNIRKQTDIIRILHKRLTDIRTNHVHQATAGIVKTKPSKVVMEDLNVRGMMKNKHIARAVAGQKFYEFSRQMEYKCQRLGIEFVKADRFYPSSKLCSCCGHKKTDLKLSDRIYCCSKCGSVIDRDLNAAINLANYNALNQENATSIFFL